jgi:spore maturation protein CgeB
MRIYYIGQLWEGGTCRERMHTLRDLGHELVPFDTTPWTSGGSRVCRFLAHRLNMGPNVWRMNRSLIDHSRTIGLVDLIWIDKGRWIYPTTLDVLREETRGRLIHYTPDPQLLFHKSRHFVGCIPLYDWVVTTKSFERELYLALGAKNVSFVLQGFDTRFIEYRPLQQETESWSSDVCFVGHFEKHYAKHLRSVSEAAPRLRIWGPGWVRYAKRNGWARNYVSGDGIWGNDYLRALAHTKIAIGLLSKWIPETTTTRTFEIPAMGTFLLAERTDDHIALFEEGKEAEFFGDDEELKSKIRFYLSNDGARKKIAAAGRERCLRSGYSSTEQLANVLAKVKPLEKYRL